MNLQLQLLKEVKNKSNISYRDWENLPENVTMIKVV